MSAIFDPRPDGLFHWVINWEGQIHSHYGRYIRVEKPHLVEMTWVSEGTKGKETLLTFEFKPENGGTLVSVTHSGFPDEASRDQHLEGWTGILANMKAYFEQK